MTEESRGNVPTSPEQAFEQASQQAREFGEKTIEQARAFNEQILESSRKVGQEALQHYVDWLQSLAEEQRRLASIPQVTEMDWFASMLKAQADFTQEFAKMVGHSPFGQQPES
jgi:vacuolar-type H+-ATPase subunit H